MNKIQALFANKKNNILSIYFTAGFPALDDTVKIISALNNSGVDLIEVGMPYSDPLADGPVIQHSSVQALKNGMTINKLFEQLKQVQEAHTENQVTAPMILMGYLNPVLQYGIEKFCANAKAAGISGVILPDVPLHEYEQYLRQTFEKNDLTFIFLITPETSEERILKIDSLSNGFIYAVSSSSITGKNANIAAQKIYFERLRDMKLRNDILIGFGISGHQAFAEACRYAAGTIIGTAYIKALEKNNDIKAATHQFVNAIKGD